MLFNQAYNYLKINLEGNTTTLKDITYFTSQTEQFEFIDGLTLTDCITSDNKGSFNSFANDDNTKVINIDILFLNDEDFQAIKEIEENYNFDDIKVKVENVYLYDI